MTSSSRARKAVVTEASSSVVTDGITIGDALGAGRVRAHAADAVTKSATTA
jgi:hypothetical protein